MRKHSLMAQCRNVALACIYGLSSLGLSSPAAGEGFAPRTVILSGDQIEIDGKQTTLSLWRLGGITSKGDVYFKGFLDPDPDAGVTGANREIAAIEIGDGLFTVAVRSGDPTPGEAGRFGSLAVNFAYEDPIFNAKGDTAFIPSTTAGGSVWTQRDGQLQRFAVEGGTAPGTPGSTRFERFATQLAFNENGNAIFGARLNGLPGTPGVEDEGIWMIRDGTLESVAISEDPAPGFTTGTVFRRLGGFSLNNRDEIAFAARVTEPGEDITAIGPSGVWSTVGGTLRPIAVTGMAAPGIDADVTFNVNVGAPKLNDAGQVAFVAGLTGEGIDPGSRVRTGNASGLWVGRPDNLRLVAREGEAFVTNQILTLDTFQNLALNKQGEVAFLGILRQGSSSLFTGGIFITRDGELQPLALAGETAPGFDPGDTFFDFDAGLSGQSQIGQLTLNGAGQIAFVGRVRGENVEFENDTGIWVTGRDGELELLVREGDLFDANDAAQVMDLRTITALTLVSASGGQGGGPIGFTDRGDLLVELGFDDGSRGLFVFAIPEPSGLVIGLGVAIAWATRRRDSRCI